MYSTVASNLGRFAEHDRRSKRSADVFFTSAALWWGFLNEPRTYRSGPRYLASRRQRPSELVEASLRDFIASETVSGWGGMGWRAHDPAERPRR